MNIEAKDVAVLQGNGAAAICGGRLFWSTVEGLEQAGAIPAPPCAAVAIKVGMHMTVLAANGDLFRWYPAQQEWRLLRNLFTAALEGEAAAARKAQAKAEAEAAL